MAEIRMAASRALSLLHKQQIRFTADRAQPSPISATAPKRPLDLSSDDAITSKATMEFLEPVIALLQDLPEPTSETGDIAASRRPRT
ncbi:hypothetical protein [Nonomuraea sp. NPDC049695]|uniref:hypothetical protein n=1 Tax=Nonomuraea sp. NPDC049695 TaxID=3154734 RepID=UPI00343F02D4